MVTIFLWELLRSTCLAIFKYILLLTLVIMLYIKFSGLIYLITGSYTFWPQFFKLYVNGISSCILCIMFFRLNIIFCSTLHFVCLSSLIYAASVYSFWLHTPCIDVSWSIYPWFLDEHLASVFNLFSNSIAMDILLCASVGTRAHVSKGIYLELCTF